MANAIPIWATHLNPLICKSQCQYVQVQSDGLYLFWKNERWNNVNNYKIKDLSHLIKIEQDRKL